MFYLNPKSMINVCGLDVHKDNIFVCIDKENGEKIQFKTGILTKELDALRDSLVANDVIEIAMESTIVYWMPIWRILENDFKLYLVNPYAIKQLPGRKSDIKDAEWIATCLRKELIRGSYVPSSEIQQLAAIQSSYL
ncbi:IS110 family transposase [Prevotella sp.]|uniref:IS110 family transposase n=2 Tax=Prevotella sp. TaxID=59823 RepID=UPI0027E38796|nr:transposase [Prevotella sp.]